MSDPYRPEIDQAEIARQEMVRQQQLERRLAKAEPVEAEAGTATGAVPKTEGEAMRAQLSDRPAPPEVATAQRLEAAETAHLRDVPVPGQMTDTPLHCQGDKPDCLLQSARMAEHRQTGVDPGLDAYKMPAIEKGIYDPDRGTSVNEMVDIINERPGIEAQLKFAQKPEDIKTALDNEESVISVVDSYEFYKDQYPWMQPDGSAHAIVITSAEKLPNGEWKFIVNDPNEIAPNLPVDGNKFLNAWDRMKRPMFVVTKK